MEKHIKAPISKEVSRKLRAGDYVYITEDLHGGEIPLTREWMMLLEMKNIPGRYGWTDDLLHGPSPAREGRPIGSAGAPTTASRMHSYAPKLLDLGLTAMIGKGKRSKEVLDAVKRNGSVYFAAVGGAGALLSKCIKTSEVVAYDDLGTEAIRKLYVEDFPVIVVADCEGGYLYESAIKEYKKI